jgi:serralysin
VNSINPQYGVDAHRTSAESNDHVLGTDGPLAAPTRHLTIPQAAVYLNRSEASWVQDAGGQILGSETTVTYAFRNTDGTYSHSGTGFTRFNAAEMANAQTALQSWSDVANIHFTQVSGTGPGAKYSDNATILFGNVSGGSGAAFGAYAYTPENASRGAGSAEGDVYVNSDISANTNPKEFAYGRQAVVHELGHAIGFLHPGDYNAGQGNPTYDDAYYAEDTLQYTVMSYWSETNTGADFKGFYPAAPQITDILAAQRLYGANLEFQTGDTVYGFNSNADRTWYMAPDGHAPIFSAWDAGGEDTFDFSGYAVKQTIDLRNGAFSDVGGMKSNVSVSWAVKVDDVIVNTIENAIGGSAKDTITGNNADNTLDGRNGDDVLIGGKGNDNLLGGDGNDILSGAKGNDTFNGGLGSDQLSGAKNFDVFIYSSLADSTVGAEDVILKGLDRLDKVDLSAIDAVAGSGNQAFHLGGDHFTNSAGELILVYSAGQDTTYIQGDVDGDGDADLSIKVQGDSHTFLNFVL